MKILFIGESWLGSCARSMREALSRVQGVQIDDLEEQLLPNINRRWLRGVNRFFDNFYRKEFYFKIKSRIDLFKPDFFICYKGLNVGSDFIKQLKIKTINIYPDSSPNSFGEEHFKSVGLYDLVISTKVFHPAQWKAFYGYNNKCLFVPQGYDPNFHLCSKPHRDIMLDVLLVATWRPQYAELMERLAELLGEKKLKVGIGGAGWNKRVNKFPKSWSLLGELHGRSYIEYLQKAKICLAPIDRRDVDTTRTYELAAAECFFIHQRTEYVKTLYNEEKEVPMFSTAEELASKISYYLEVSSERERMLKAAHKRAVPAYSLDVRAKEIVSLLKQF